MKVLLPAMAVIFAFLTACTSPTARVVGSMSDQQPKCAIAADLSVLEKDGQPQICYDKELKRLEFTLLNQVNSRIKAIDAEFYSVGGVFPAKNIRSADEGMLFKGRAYYDWEQYGSIQKVRLIPTIDIEGLDYVCTNRALAVDQIETC